MNFNRLKNKNIKIDKDVAYFIGVLHSDGCIYHFHDKKKPNLVRIRLLLGVGYKSLPMTRAFKKILSQKFGRKVNIRRAPNRNLFVIQTSINNLYSAFIQWENGKLPEEIRLSSRLFGAYLAGLIDGDGSLTLKNNKDRRLKQLVIRIASQDKLFEVKELIERYTPSKVHFQNYRTRNCYDTSFYVTYKNLLFLEQQVFPNVRILYKKKRFEKYIKKIKRACRDSNPESDGFFLNPKPSVLSSYTTGPSL